MEKINPFEFHETDHYVACVGENGGTDNFDIREGFKSSVIIMIEAVENGAYEDTLIYPVVYNIRHSIELSLKIILEKMLCICGFKNISFPDRNRMYTHDISILDEIIKKYYSVDKRIVKYYNQVSPYLQDYYFDTKGDAFKYETDHTGNPHLIKWGISSISYDVLKKKYIEMMKIFDDLVFEAMYLCGEYGVGTFTKNLSREDIKDIAKMLPPREQWRDEIFSACKEKIKNKYLIGSKEFSNALNIIQGHMEFCTYIGMEIKLGEIAENELCEYVKLVMGMNGDRLYEKETKTQAYSGNELLSKLRVDAQKRAELSKNISDSTLVTLLVFREYSNSMGLFSEKAESILQHFSDMRLDRNDLLRKLEKRDTFRKILFGMKRCGQVAYRKIIKNEFEKCGKELIELDYVMVDE